MDYQTPTDTEKATHKVMDNYRKISNPERDPIAACRGLWSAAAITLSALAMSASLFFLIQAITKAVSK